MAYQPDRNRAVDWCLWVGCGLIVAGGVGALVVAAGRTDRISDLALPFAIAAVALAANALTWRRTGGFALLLYAAAAVAIVYGLLRLLSLPLRLLIEGRCQPAPAPCPLGFDYPLTNGENLGIYIAVFAGALALLFSFIAVEMQYRRRPARPVAVGSPAPAPAPNLESAPAPASPPVAERDQDIKEAGAGELTGEGAPKPAE